MRKTSTKEKSRTNARSRRLGPAKSSSKESEAGWNESKKDLAAADKARAIEMMRKSGWKFTKTRATLETRLSSLAIKISEIKKWPFKPTMVRRRSPRGRIHREMPHIENHPEFGSISDSVLMFILKMHRSGWEFTYRDGGLVAEYIEPQITRHLSLCQIEDYADRGLSTQKVISYAGYTVNDNYREKIDNALDCVFDAKQLLECYAFAKAGLSGPATHREFDAAVGCDTLAVVLRKSAQALRNAEADSELALEPEPAPVVESKILGRTPVIQAGRISADDVRDFIVLADGNLETIAQHSGLCLEKVTDSGGETIWAIVNNDLEILCGAVAEEDAKEVYLELVTLKVHGELGIKKNSDNIPF